MPDQPTEPGPRWSALRVGPGGVPADQVRPVGLPEPVQPVPSAGPWPPAGPDTTPHAVLGSFAAGRPRRRAIIGVTCLGLVALVVVAAALWSSDTPGTSSATSLRAGDCLASAGGTTVIGLDCAASEAEFVIAARFERTTDDSRCYLSSSDVVLVTRDDVVLCLNYIARVGDCLYAGNTDAVGKAPCRTSASGSTPRGLFRVIAVLADTVSSRACPAGTLETLVHRDNREVVCLGMP
jgi:hypothetical protein